MGYGWEGLALKQHVKRGGRCTTDANVIPSVILNLLATTFTQ